jgi:hypothetical protein
MQMSRRNREKHRSPVPRPTGTGLLAMLALGGVAYLLYRRAHGLGNGDYAKPIKRIEPVRPKPWFWQGAVELTKSSGVPQQATPKQSVVLEPSNPEYLKFREKRISAAKPYDVWLPDRAPPSVKSAAMSFMLPVVKTPILKALEEAEHQRAYDLQEELEDDKASIRADLRSVSRWVEELGGVYEAVRVELNKREAAKFSARTQDEIDKAEDEILLLRLALENTAVEIHRKHEGGHQDSARVIEYSVDSIREEFGNEEAERAKLELTTEMESRMREYKILPSPNSKQFEQRASALLDLIGARQDLRLMSTNPEAWLRVHEEKQEAARQEAEESRIGAEEIKLYSNPLLYGKPGPEQTGPRQEIKEPHVPGGFQVEHNLWVL